MGTSTRKPEEKEIIPDIAAFRVPNAAEAGTESVVTVEGTISYGTGDFCVATLEEINKNEINASKLKCGESNFPTY